MYTMQTYFNKSLLKNTEQMILFIKYEISIKYFMSMSQRLKKRIHKRSERKENERKKDDLVTLFTHDKKT